MLYSTYSIAKAKRTCDILKCIKFIGMRYLIRNIELNKIDDSLYYCIDIKKK